MLSETALKFIQNTDNRGQLEGATHFGVGGTKGDGPYVQLWLDVQEGTIRRSSFDCNGCPSSLAVSSALSQLLIGRTLEIAAKIEARDLILILQGLPDGKEYYADLAVEALRNAIATISEERI